jgi:hypothetical protein
MKDHYDPWYVRLPDGRTIKAKSTASLRHHLESGNVPLNSMARRTSNDEWQALSWIGEFADLYGGRPMAAAQPVPENDTNRSGVHSRLDPMRLQTIGIRGMIDELLAAVDSTLTSSKLLPAFAAGLLLYLGMFFSSKFASWITDAKWLGVVFGAAIAVVILSVASTIITKLAHIELSTFRPAKLKEGIAEGTKYVVPVLIAHAIVVGGALGLLFLMTKVPEWVGRQLIEWEINETLFEVIFTPVSIIVLLVSVALWLLIGIAWSIAPAIIVEEHSWITGLREWRALVKEHRSRLLMYEGMAFALGLLLCLPFSLAVGMAMNTYPSIVPRFPTMMDLKSNLITGAVESGVAGLAAAPLIATLAVTNVYIYLNLRYEQSGK